jgi:TolB protein
MPSVEELEERYHHLQAQLLRQELAEDEFRAQVDQLRFEDAQGRQWRLGAFSGQWYRSEGGQWIKGNPRLRLASEPVAAAPPATTRRPGGLVAILAIVFLLALVLVGLTWIDWGQPVATPVAVITGQPTQPPGASATLAPSPMVLPSIAIDASPARSATATATEPALRTPTATPGTSPSATAERTATAVLAGIALRGWIAVPVYNSLAHTFDIHRVRPDGSDRDVLVRSASQPALSPDGKWLAYRSWRNDQRALIARPVAGGDLWPFATSSEAARPGWSPVDGSLVYASRQESDRRSRIHRTLDTEAVLIRRHGGGVEGQSPAWLPDGRVIYQGCVESRCGLLIMNADGTFPVQITDHTSDTAPEPSADGTRIAFMSQRDGNWEVYLIHSDGTHLTRLTDHPAHDGLPVWSPEGRDLAFVSNRTGAWAVWVMDLDGSSPRKLFELGGDLEGRVAVAQAHEQGDWTQERISWAP